MALKRGRRCYRWLSRFYRSVALERPPDFPGGGVASKGGALGEDVVILRSPSFSHMTRVGSGDDGGRGSRGTMVVTMKNIWISEGMNNKSKLFRFKHSFFTVSGSVYGVCSNENNKNMENRLRFTDV